MSISRCGLPWHVCASTIWNINWIFSTRVTQFVTVLIWFLQDMQVLRRCHISIQMRRSAESCFRDKEDNQRQTNACEDGNKIEAPRPPYRVSDLADQNRRE